MGHVLLLYLRNSTQGHTFSLVFSPRSCIDLGFQLGLWSVLSKTFCLVWGVGPSFVLFACVCLVTQVLSNSLRPHGLWPTRLLCPWDFPSKNTGIGCHFLLQGIFPTQVSKLRLLHWQSNSLPLSRLEGPWVTLSDIEEEKPPKMRYLGTQIQGLDKVKDEGGGLGQLEV